MSRYTGPKWRINRREGATVLGSSEKWKRRSTLPGQFAVLKKRPSEYAYQFREKQKLKRMYGMNEAQFERFYRIALKSPNTSTRLLQLLEQRVDNVIFRLGLAKTRAQARQMVTHGHIKINNKKHNVPSTIMEPGDEVTINDDVFTANAMKAIIESNKALQVPTWIEKLEKGGKVQSEPTRDQMDKSIKERLVVELYSR
jgi:small subunit ribosomal protein S4